jgi:hypothetical protein
MKEVIKTVKDEIKRLRPIVEEFYRLENLLAFLEGPNKNITNIDDGTIKKRGNNRGFKIRINASIPEDIRNKYNLNIGDTFNSALELSRIINVDKNIVYNWIARDGYINSTKNKKRVYIQHNTPVKITITDMMPQKLQKKYDITPQDSWHSVDDMRYKLGISLPLVGYWHNKKYIDFFEV